MNYYEVLVEGVSKSDNTIKVSINYRHFDQREKSHGHNAMSHDVRHDDLIVDFPFETPSYIYRIY